MAATLRLKNISELLKESKPVNEDELVKQIKSKYIRDYSLVH
mgnify:CR=1 FL=1